MSSSTNSPVNPGRRNLARAAQVIVVSSVMFTFISYWRTAAVVLCDLASTSYYIGGIVEQAIGPAAPWYILAVMIFSYAVRSVYIESCSLFVRGGVYRVVKEAMGGLLAKLSVSALMFDYILTGPTSGVSAGQYIMGLILQSIKLSDVNLYQSLGLGSDHVRDTLMNWGSVIIASIVTFYFFRQNLYGLHESSDKAKKIMIATTIMAAIMLSWCVLTLCVRGPVNDIPWKPDLDPKVELKKVNVVDPETGKETEEWQKNPETGKLEPALDPETHEPVPQTNAALEKLGIISQDDPLGFLGRILPEDVVRRMRHPNNWLSLIGVIGLLMAFGHSILAMSGEETLAQVYREVESPKLPNFKKAAFIVFVYSVVLTAGISFLAVALIPDQVRMKDFQANLIGGLARYVIGPPMVKLGLEAFVVVVGFLILAGAVNTAIIGSNGVLNRVAEDGVLPDWFLKPHPRYGTTYRLLYLILFLQLAVILLSGGDMVLLGEAYAFGVVWSFVFKALAMVVLRFKDRTHREYKVPLNIRVGNVEVPIGLSLIFLILFATAILNFFTKEVATLGGLTFTGILLTTFIISERAHEKRLRGRAHEHLDQFNQASVAEISPESLHLTKLYRKLVAIRSTHNLYMLEKTLAETDPHTTNVIVMTAKVTPVGDSDATRPDLDTYDQQLMTAVVGRAESAGKEVKPLIVPTNNPLHAVLRTAKDLRAQEVIMGASNKYTADEQLDQITLYWFNLHEGAAPPLTVRILSRNRDVHFDIGGGSRIPKISERRARSVAELRAAGVGVDRVLLLHEDTRESSDLFQAVLTMLDPQVALAIVSLAQEGDLRANGQRPLQHDLEQAGQLGRHVEVSDLKERDSASLVRYLFEGKFDLLILSSDPEAAASALDTQYLLRHAPCRIFLSAPAAIPQEPEA